MSQVSSWSFLSLAILGLCLVFGSGQTSAAEPRPIFSLNATTVPVDSWVTLTCDLSEYPHLEGLFYVNFFRDAFTGIGGYFATYEVSASPGAPKTSKFKADHALPGATYQPLSSTFPLYQISLRPSDTLTHTYYCILHKDTEWLNVLSRNSQTLLVTTQHPTTAVISIQDLDSTPTLGRPFTLTCTLSHLTPLPANYLVKFHSLIENQLATYEVTNGQSLLEDAFSEKVAVSRGWRSAYPTFDLQVTEKLPQTSSYWCTVEEAGQQLAQSNYYPQFIYFFASSHSVDPRVGTCALGVHLELGTKPYAVQFLSDFEAKQVTLLAEYIVKPSHGVELKTAHVANWGHIGHGSETVFPSFQIKATGTFYMKGSWWCRLVQGTPGSADYREFNSNKEGL